MPINNYKGETFVAFLDVSGFKVLMSNDEKRAFDALGNLYQYGYDAIKQNQSVEGIFISDSGILFVRNIQNKIDRLRSLLTAIKQINQKALTHDIMLTTSIAYGEFSYQDRLEFVGISKDLIYGNAYVSAWFDNEKGKPRIQPGQCRIVKKNLPFDQNLRNEHDAVFRLVEYRSADNEHYYFYWNLEDSSWIKDFERKYQDSYNLRYRGMLEALKRPRG